MARWHRSHARLCFRPTRFLRILKRSRRICHKSWNSLKLHLNFGVTAGTNRGQIGDTKNIAAPSRMLEFCKASVDFQPFGTSSCRGQNSEHRGQTPPKIVEFSSSFERGQTIGVQREAQLHGVAGLAAKEQWCGSNCLSPLTANMFLTRQHHPFADGRKHFVPACNLKVYVC